MIKKNFAKKSLLLLGVSSVALTIFFSSESIRAQIQGLYDNSNNQVVGVSALMSAVTSNDVTGVKFFSKAGRATVNQKNVGGATALHMACREKNFEIVKILVENEADVNAVDNEGWTPLMRGALAGDKDIVDLLLIKGAQASSINSSGESAILHAAMSDCSDCLNSMFEKYNFIKLMDVRLLKEQLTEAFVIARNRENQPAQIILEAYLDRVVKMGSFMESDTSGLTAAQSQRIFRFTSPEGKSQQFSEPVPMIAKGSPSTAIVTKRFKLVSGENGKSLHDYTEQNPNAISIEKPGSTQNYGAVRYKLVAPAGAANTEVAKNAVANDQIKKDKRVIYLLKTPAGDKSEVAKTAAAPQAVAPTVVPAIEIVPEVTKEETSESSSFKFNKGETGKVVKHKKPKKPVVKKVELLAPTPQPVIIAPPAPAVQPVAPKPAPVPAPAAVKVQTTTTVTPVAVPPAPAKPTAPAPKPVPKENDDKSIIIDLSNSSK
ncbi:MAG: ankyrin repeat domain-containing protein [Pseudomonadota bacterium]